MKKYLLTVFGDFESKDCEEIANCLEPIVDSTHLKFQYRSGVIIFHFASEFEISDVNDFLTLLSYDFYNSFMLLENTKDVLVFMEDDMKQHLFDLDNDSECSFKINITPNNRFDTDYDDNEFYDKVTTLLNEVKKNLQEPTLDQLLDKINEHGVKLLTPYEKAILDNYSKK